MTQAQKNAKAKFKQAIAYRQKTGVSLKEAFAHIYGKKKVGAVKKKSAPKKKAAKKVVKKKATKKVIKKKAAKKVVSKTKISKISINGINDKILKDLQSINDRERYYKDQLMLLEDDYIFLKKQKNSRGHQIANKRMLDQVKNILKTLKIEKSNIKKHIK